jgi:hypothetical protein
MSTILMTRDALTNAGGFLPPGLRPLRTCDNVEFYLRLTQHCDFSVVPESLVTCREHKGERSSDGLASMDAPDELAYVVGQHAASLEGHPREYAELLARVGARYLRIGERATGLRYMRSALSRAPGGAAMGILKRFAPFTLKSLVRPGRTKTGAPASV